MGMSVTVSVVNIGGVLVLVLGGVVSMRVRVHAGNRRIVKVAVVAVVMPMGVLVLDGVVNVAMTVSLGQVQVDSDGEQAGGNGGEGSSRTGAE